MHRLNILKTRTPRTLMEIKAKLLCDGFQPDQAVAKLIREQNPSQVKRGGLSSGAKLRLVRGNESLTVNAPVYYERPTDLNTATDPLFHHSSLFDGDEHLCGMKVLPAPRWYGRRVSKFAITQILTEHGKQLAGSIYEDCALFSRGDACQFCVMNHSLAKRDPQLVRKSPNLFLRALEQIPIQKYDGLVLNGGMTQHAGRGFELLEPVVSAIHERYPQLPIALEMTPPTDLAWIDRIIAAGASGLMMNLECWDDAARERFIPGKNALCPKEQYFAAFARANELLGPGKTSTCFVLGTEETATLKEGICAVADAGVIPSPLAGRHFEDVPGYSFAANVNWVEFLDVLAYTQAELAKRSLVSADRAGCVACGMCDLVKDI